MFLPQSGWERLFVLKKRLAKVQLFLLMPNALIHNKGKGINDETDPEARN